ncbi:TMV resistance protein N isoform X2 [Vigna radiata var. radiata]|uniref:TMV resistance protein N isoform X2 n=1 Tax=Vigna radiata var. radiata TaxID=3916 RepID=A0A3Q0EV41_VIGRR|nr:TMV resistance protein N isoform X2 [Vigna radiata var. radiata]
MSSNAIVQYTVSSSHTINRYDVFVSFRGEDTCNNFTGFLFQALRRKAIDVFKDDEDLKKGESIAPELLHAIQSSRLFIVVFSKNYASSTWCLRELAEIRNCVQTSPRPIIPVFYDVDPSVVRKQSECYEKAFAEHEKRFREDKAKMEEAERWREALTEVANLSGWDIRNKPQYVEIEKIVQTVTNILDPKICSLPKDELVRIEHTLEELVGIERRLESINNVRVIGISGMGGIGKTILARALYERIYHQYDFHCFIDDVSKIYRYSSSLGVQKQLVSQSLNEKNQEISNSFEGTCLTWSRLHNVRALVVLDNVDEVEQLRMFTGNRDTLLRQCLGGGSIIIVVSRDEHILRTYGVDYIYQVQPLNHKNAMQLFCKNAFKVNHISSDYEKLAWDVLSHAQGHPLAIEVIGSSLFGRNVSQWKSALARLKENKTKNIMDVLRVSFDQLDEDHKEIFLDIACVLCDCDEKYTREVLNFRGFHVDYSLQVLLEKSLISKMGTRIYMHNLLKDLGRYIVKEESPKEPLKRSRLWDYQDFCKAMLNNQTTQILEVIAVNSGWISGWKSETVKIDGLSKIEKLKFLRLENVKCSGSLSHLSNELGYLTWNNYPFECLPQNFEPHKLVKLKLRNSRIQRLWSGTKELPNLKHLDLSYSEKLVEMPDVAKALNLEEILLEDCIELRKLSPSISFLRKLTILSLRNCINLVSVPNNILGFNSLEYLSVYGCSKLFNNELLEEASNTEHLKKLCSVEGPLQSHSTSPLIKKARRESVSCLLPSFPTLPYLRELDLSWCKLVKIPDVIGKLSCLEKLNLKGNHFVTLPNLTDLYRLYYLNLEHCSRLKYLPDLPSQTNLPPKVYWHEEQYMEDIFVCLRANDIYVAGLRMFYCPEIVEWERCTDMAISWMLQILQSWYKSKCLTSLPFLKSLGSTIDGSEILKWFNNQLVSMDNSIIIDASPFVHDNNWVGVVCCAILNKHAYKSRIYAYSGSDLSVYDFDHMCLFYYSRQQFLHEQHIFRGKLNTRDLSLTRDLVRIFDVLLCRKRKDGNQVFPKFKVKKYGYRWVTVQDLHDPWLKFGSSIPSEDTKLLL